MGAIVFSPRVRFEMGKLGVVIEIYKLARTIRAKPLVAFLGVFFLCSSGVSVQACMPDLGRGDRLSLCVQTCLQHFEMGR